MPNLDGFGATSAIRQSGIQIPIVAMTANALRGDREECIEKGMNDYISKPVERGELIRVLRRWLVDGFGDGDKDRGEGLNGLGSGGEMDG